jgi:transglutaminase-like putative cysteine protease
MPEFNIQHITKYIYQGYVRDSANQIILYPINDSFQKVLKHELTITGNPDIDNFTDYYGNNIGMFTYCSPHYELEIFSKVSVVTNPRQLPVDDIFIADQWRDLERLRKMAPYIDYLKQEYFEKSDLLNKIVLSKKRDDDTPYQTSLNFCRYVFEHFDYIPGITTVETTLDEIWNLKAGVCQDFAHILLVMLRMINIPARYVSGYICPNKSGMRGEGATHAWVEVYIPGYGWLGLDPTNNCVANETHVRLAVGRSFTDCSPVKGVYKGAAGHVLKVAVSVAYENDDHNISIDIHDIPEMKAIEDLSKNSFQRYMEIVQQQQQ